MTNKKNLYTSGEYLKENPSWHLEDSPWKARKIIKVIPKDIFSKSNSTMKIVDVGCGPGEILKLVCKYFRDNGFSAAADGYDISPAIIEAARKNFSEASFYCHEFDKEKYKAPRQNIDIALLIDIFEHIENPEHLLRDISEVSTYAICHIPLEDNLEVKIRGLKKRFKKSLGHINYYNKKNAVELIEKNGFSIENMIFTCLDYDSDYIIKSLARRLIAQPLRKIFFKNFPGFTASVLGNCSIMFFLRSLKRSNVKQI
ncbi:class I SAM-dependent methyltransferase [Candidatus Omnitrophota bacterium]